MKKIFWTTIFWLVIVLIFLGYLRWFDEPLAKNVSNLIGVENVCEQTETKLSSDELMDEILIIKVQLDKVLDSLNKMSDVSIKEELAINSPKKVDLYYFNELEDSKLSIEQQLNSSSVLPVSRVISSSKNIIEDTIKLLLEGNLTPNEVEGGFITEFPNQDFRLISSNLKSDGTLELIFNEVPGFTSGGSARVFILRASIEKTAKQFPMVKSVKILPEELFQP